MAVRGEEVAGSIDAHVRETLEKMVDEIRSSIEDVRVAVDQQLKAALQSVQADVNSVTFLPHIQKAVGDLEEQLAASVPAAAPGGAASSRIKEAIQAIEHGKSQVDVLNALLDQCLSFGSRAALLILRGETFSGWKGVGFSIHGGNDELVKRFNAAPGLLPELDRVLRDEQVVVWDGASLSTRLGVSAGVHGVLVPMVIKDKVAAAVFVDVIEKDETQFDPSAIELLVFTTGLLIDTLAMRKKTPSPSLQESGTPASEPVPAPPAPRPAAPSQNLADETASRRPVTAPSAAVPAPPQQPSQAGTVAINSAQMREMMAQQRPSFNVPPDEDFGASAAPTARVSAPPPPPPPAAPAPSHAAHASSHASGAAEERPTTQYVPPAGVARGGALGGGPQSEDAKKHDEARRFARLLVSEIKLYNETKVDQGRKNNDLYERLKEDIDRSRQMYDERIPDDVRKVSNYFYDELVRILAEGRADALGL